MGAVLVRWARLDGVDPHAEALNTSARIGDAALRDDDRRRIVGVRLLLLRSLDELGLAGAAVLRQTCDRCGGEHGRPVLAIDGRPGPHVSLGHAGDVAIVALGAVPLGIDVEPLDAAVDVQAWTRTEAVLKATGHGLDVDPGLLDVGPSRVTAWRGPGRRPFLRVRTIDAISSHAVALAISGRRPRRVDVDERTLRPA